MAPSSPKEKRRSARRSAHSSSKSSGSGSPSPDSAPLPAPPSLSDAARSAASSSSTSNSTARGKRAKDDADGSHVPAPPPHRRTASVASTINGTGIAPAPAPAPSKRAKRKGKDAAAPTDDAIDAAPVDTVDQRLPEAATDGEKAEEDGGVTRCVCEGLDDDADAPDFMIQCEQCLTWQHGPCMGFPQESEIPEGVYYCEQCKPEDHVELLKRLARRQRHSSEKLAQVSQRSRTSRSHSPTHFLKTTKRRNTMNSRDAAYEESIQELLDATAAEAAPQTDTPGKDRSESVAKTEEAYEEIIEIGPGGRKKRKRLDDDVMPTKRKRSTSLTPEDVGSAVAAPDKAEVTATITTALLPPPAPTGKSRARRGGRKNAAAAAAQEPSLNGEGEDGGTPTTKKHPNQYTYRAKNVNGQSRRGPQSSTSQNQQNTSTHEHGTRRNASNTANSSGGSGGGSRNSHNAYYNNVQLPMFASWGLPDYLAHLQSILPSEVPPPLQIRGATSFLREDVGDPSVDYGDAGNAASNIRGSMGPPPSEPAEIQSAQIANALASATESVTERGVKVKWPAKRMSVTDMNKRVRALVEWVGREQALALDRERRKVALKRALQAHSETLRLTSNLPSAVDGAKATNAMPNEPSAMSVDGPMPVEASENENSTALELDRLETLKPSFSSGLSLSNMRPSTSKMMEELMEELISFQERFGPSAKGQARERRIAALS